MSFTNISDSSVVSDLNWYIKTFDFETPADDLFNYFSKPNCADSIIILKNCSFYKLLSKSFFNRVLSPHAGLSLVDENIGGLCEQINTEPPLIIPHNMPVNEAFVIALQRSESCRYEPVLIKLSENDFGIIDFISLARAQLALYKETSNKLLMATEFKRDIIGILTHDLRNVLNSVQGFALIIEEGLCSKEETKEFSGFIKNSSKQISALLLKMLYSFSEESAEITIYKTSFDLLPVLKDLVAGFGSASGIKQQQLTLRILNLNKKRDLFADRQKIRDVIETLISNAIKVTGTKGKVVVTLIYKEDNIQVSVEDNGPGMIKKDVKTVFEDFIRLGPGATRGEFTTGINLYISKKIIDLHSGIIQVLSRPGKGSVFSIELPG